MKIAFLSSSGQLGGAELCLLELLCGLRRQRPDWALHLIVGEDGPLVGASERAGVRVWLLPFPKRLARLGEGGGALRRLVSGAAAVAAIAQYRARVRSALQQIGPRVIHSNGIKMHVMSAIANTGAAPVIWHLRDYLGRRSLSARLLRQLCSSCAVAVAVSHDVAADADRVFKGRCPKVVAQYDGVDVQSFSPQGDAADLDLLARLPAPPPGSVRIGLVATYGRWKGHEVFLRALARLDRDKRWRGYVVGGALYQTRDSQYSVEELKGLARGLDLPADRLGFTGHVADSARALRALDVVVHASTQPEPFGRVIVEGMACAKAVIYSNAGGAAELAKDGETALGTRPGDDAHLAGHLGRLIDDPALRARLGAAGRVWARDRFDAGQHVPAFIELYGNVLEQHGARPALA